MTKTKNAWLREGDAPDSAQLVILSGALHGTVVELSNRPVGLGRDLDNVVQLSDDFVSRHHAELVCDGGQYRLRDLDSANGTYVNGNRIRETILQTGDRLRIAGVALRFEAPPGGVGSAMNAVPDPSPGEAAAPPVPAVPSAAPAGALRPDAPLDAAGPAAPRRESLLRRIFRGALGLVLDPVPPANRLTEVDAKVAPEATPGVADTGTGPNGADGDESAGPAPGPPAPASAVPVADLGARAVASPARSESTPPLKKTGKIPEPERPASPAVIVSEPARVETPAPVPLVMAPTPAADTLALKKAPTPKREIELKGPAAAPRELVVGRPGSPGSVEKPPPVHYTTLDASELEPARPAPAPVTEAPAAPATLVTGKRLRLVFLVGMVIGIGLLVGGAAWQQDLVRFFGLVLTVLGALGVVLDWTPLPSRQVIPGGR